MLFMTTFANAQTEDAVYYKYFSDPANNIDYIHIVSEDNYSVDSYCQLYFSNYTAVGNPGYNKAVRVRSALLHLIEDGFEPILLTVNPDRTEAFALSLDHVFQIRNENGVNHPYGAVHPASSFDLSCGN